MKTNELSCKDLMIGDWVTGKKWRENPFKLTRINDNGKYYYGITSDGTQVGPFLFEEIEPILLTPEILIKNGFTHSFGDSDFYDYEKWEKKVDDKTIRVIKDHDGWFCRVDDIKLTRSMGIAPAVHTMQNIIRIGGIDKTIEL